MAVGQRLPGNSVLFWLSLRDIADLRILGVGDGNVGYLCSTPSTFWEPPALLPEHPTQFILNPVPLGQIFISVTLFHTLVFKVATLLEFTALSRGFNVLLDSCHCNEIPEKGTYKEKVLIWAHGFRG